MAGEVQKKKGYLRGIRGALITALNPDGSLPDTPEKYWIDTAQEASVEAQVEEGESSVLRGGDRVLAQVEEEDTITGVEISFTDAKFDAKASTIIAGGTLITDTTDTTEIIGWEAPMMADQSNRIPFMMEIFVQNYNGSGMKEGFLKITVPYCTGTMPAMEYSDQEWASEEFTIKGKENSALTPPVPVTRKEFVASLPPEASAL
ncbi:hypothetical protein [Weizmannia phage Youna2]